MPTFSEGRSPSRPTASGAPSLIGAGNQPPLPETGTRVLAHLEGRKPPYSNTQLIGGGVIAAIVLGVAGLGAWQLGSDEDQAESTVAIAQQNGVTTSATTPATPATQEIAQAESTPFPLDPQPARIIEATPAPDAASPQPAAPHSPLASLDAAAIAAAAPLAAALPGMGHTAQAAGNKEETPTPAHAAQAASAKPQQTAAKSVRATSATKKPVAKQRRAVTRTAQASKAKADPDADLLAALLQRRDPRTVVNK